MGKQFHRFVTFTLEGTQETLVDVRRHLMEAMRAIQRSVFWKRTIRGGAWFVEITRGSAGDHWHVHAHAIVTGNYIDREELSAAWRLASGGSFIVHVRAIDDNDAGAEYVSRYSTKGVGRELSRWPDRLVEAIIALKGSRLIGTFGDWWAVDLEQEQEEQVEWGDPVELGPVIAAAAQREPWAVGLMLQLRKVAILRGGVVMYQQAALP